VRALTTHAPSWIADSFNINTWMIVSSSVQAGMAWWQAWLCVWLGYGIAAPFIVLNARPGAVHHITFPVVARTSFGVWGSLWVRRVPLDDKNVADGKHRSC
jgi:NCS1 family nucleobase:cation symporter-1